MLRDWCRNQETVQCHFQTADSQRTLLIIPHLETNGTENILGKRRMVPDRVRKESLKHEINKMVKKTGKTKF